MVRGAARGITVPMNLSALWSSLQLLSQEMDGASGVAIEGSFFQSLFNGLVKEGEILGSLRAGVHWTPTVFATAQKDCVDSFFSQTESQSAQLDHLKCANKEISKSLQVVHEETNVSSDSGK